MPRVTLERAVVITRWPCSTCDAVIEKDLVVARYVDDDDDEHYVCGDCLKAGPAALANRRGGIWKLPSYDEWQRANRDAESAPPPPHHFHGCPQCPPERGPDDIYNAGSSRIAACHEHRTTWYLGSNLLSWRDETEDYQRRRWREIEDYADVGPLLPAS
jgi:hypothetical protein